MITGSASRDAKYSVVAMVIFGLIALSVLFFILDRWLLSGLYTEKVVSYCRLLGATCQNAFLSVDWSPLMIALVIGMGALAFATIRAAIILISSKRKSANFFLTTGVQSRKLQKAVGKLAGLQQQPEVKFLTDQEPLAFTSGLFKPKIYISDGLIDALTAKELEAVILHEYAHVKRKDNLAIFSMLFLRDFLFMLPLAHFLFRIYIREKENAADDYVVGEIKDPSTLASAILKLVRLNHFRKDPSPAYATFFPSKATAESRIVRLVGQPAVNRKRELLNLALAFITSVLIIALLTGATFKVSADNAAKGCQNGITCEKENCDCCAAGELK